MMEQREIRSISDIEIREAQDSMLLEGYIAKFDTYTELWDGFFEKIDRNAFDETLSDGHNIFLLFNHNYNKPLASTRNNTLTLTTDEIGLKFSARINEKLSYAKDVYELVKSGEMRGCSFGFYAKKDEYVYDSEKDEYKRTLLNLHLYEGTITPVPAYDTTVVQARAKDIADEEKEKLNQDKELESLKADLELIAIENELL